MGQERFSSLALLNIESDLTGAVVPEDIFRQYATTEWKSSYIAELVSLRPDTLSLFLRHKQRLHHLSWMISLIVK